MVTSILTLASCGGGNELTIYLYQDNVIYRSICQFFKKQMNMLELN